MNRVSLSALSVVAIAAGSLVAITACSKATKSEPSGAGPAVRTPATEGARGGAMGTPTGGGGEGGAIGMPADKGGAAPGGPDDQFAVETVGVTGAAGAESIARVVVRPGKGFHMNKDYPTKLTLEVPAGVTTAKAVLEPTDAETFDDSQLAFAVKLTAAAAGDYSVPATLKFAVCTDSTCNPKKTSIALSLKAQ